MDFNYLVKQILEEDNVAGGGSSVFGPNVGNTATVFSGDNYAAGDARKPHSLYGGVITRSGMRKKRKKSKFKKPKN